MNKEKVSSLLSILLLSFSISIFLPFLSIDANAAGRQYVVLSENSTVNSANLISGNTFNTCIKQLVSTSADYEKPDSKITKVIFMSTGNGYTSKGTDVENYLSNRGVTIGYEAYGILEDSTVYIYTRANKFLFNADCTSMFNYLKSFYVVEFGKKVDTGSMWLVCSMFWG